MNLSTITERGAFTSEAWLLVGLVVAFAELGLPEWLAWPAAAMYGAYALSRVVCKATRPYPKEAADAPQS